MVYFTHDFCLQTNQLCFKKICESVNHYQYRDILKLLVIHNNLKVKADLVSLGGGGHNRENFMF